MDAGIVVAVVQIEKHLEFHTILFWAMLGMGKWFSVF